MTYKVEKTISLPGRPVRCIRIGLRFLSRQFFGLRRSCEGVSAIEFALITPVLLVFLIGVTDFGLAMFHKMELQSAVRAGAQYALSDGNDTASIISAVVSSTGAGITSSDVTLTCQCLDTSTEVLTGTTCGSTGCASSEAVLMTIDAASTYTPLLTPNLDTSSGSVTRFLSFIPSSFDLTASVTIRIE